MTSDSTLPQKLDEKLRPDVNGLIAAVVQHCETGQVLMLGYMNREAISVTLRERRACFWSRSRRKLWRKGESSGNVLRVVEVRIDCDGDALLLRCDPAGPACHTNETSCFYRTVDFDGAVALAGDGVATD
jgi:phosphoribosyl-AMP cyclohydrolase